MCFLKFYSKITCTHIFIINIVANDTDVVFRAGSVVVNYVINVPKVNSATKQSAIINGIKGLNGTFAGYEMDPSSVGVSGM